MKYVNLLNMFLTKYIQLSYRQCIEWFGLPVFIGCPDYRNVNQEQSLPLKSVSKGLTPVLLTASLA